MIEAAKHPLFARGYERTSRKTEERGQREHRQTLLAGLTGNVVESARAMG
jgi:hypothetical protein